MRSQTCSTRSITAIVLWVIVLLTVPYVAAKGGNVDPIFGGSAQGFLGKVAAVAEQPDGKILVAGGRIGLVRLNSDGSMDTAFQTGVERSAADVNVETLCLQTDGRILIGGYFTRVGGLQHPHIARLNPDGGLDESFHASVGSDVSVMVLQPDGKILISSRNFLGDVNGVQVDGVARLNADGSLDVGFTGNSPFKFDMASSIAVQPDGKILVGGQLFGVAGSASDNVIRLNADGSLDTTFNAGRLNHNTVNAVAVQGDGKVLVGGRFDFIDILNPKELVRLTPDGSLDSDFVAAPTSEVQTLLVQPDGKILVGSYGLARLNLDGSNDPSFQSMVLAESYSSVTGVRSIALEPDGGMVIGGGFSQVDGIARNSIARLHPDGSLEANFVPDTASGPNAAIYNIAVRADGKILLQGFFTQVNGTSLIDYARLNSDGTVDQTFHADNPTYLYSKLASDGYKILVYPVSGLSRLNADGSSDTDFAPTFSGADLSYYNVAAVAVDGDGKIFVSGRFTTVNEVATNYLARLNPDGSLDGNFKASVDAPVTAVILQTDGQLVIMGSFTVVNGIARNGVARVYASGELDQTFESGIDNALIRTVQPDGKYIVQGATVSQNGMRSDRYMRLNNDGSVDPTFACVVNGTVSGVVVEADGKIVLGGNFSQVNGQGRNNLARLNSDGSIDPFSNLDSGTDGPVYALAAQTDGKISLGGDYTSINGVLRNYIARLKANGAPDFFGGQVDVGSGFYYMEFPNGNSFGYYNPSGAGYSFPYLFHADLGFEYFFDAEDGFGGAYLYDFASNDFFYTSPKFSWPYLYDFDLNTVLYYYPDPNNQGHYNTNGIRYFYNFSTGQIITK